MTTITTPLSQERLCLEVKVNLPILTDEILEDLRIAIAIELGKRNDTPLQQLHWVNMSRKQQDQLMRDEATDEVYADWKKQEKLKRNRRYPKKRELTLADK